MYMFHYEYFKPKFSKSQLLFTDCDSLAYHIVTDDFYKDISNDCERWFDTSGQKDTRNGNLPLGLNKKIIGLLKDEAGDSTISEFVGLRAKLYSFVVNNDYDHATKKAKGVKKAVLDKTIKFDDFMDVLESSKPQERSITMFHNKNHEIHTINQTK